MPAHAHETSRPRHRIQTGILDNTPSHTFIMDKIGVRRQPVVPSAQGAQPAPVPQPSAALQTFIAAGQLSLKDHVPSTGFGMFDLVVDPGSNLQTGLLTASVRIHMNYSDPIWQQKTAAGITNAQDFENRMKSEIENAWSGKFQFKRPGYTYTLGGKKQNYLLNVKSTVIFITNQAQSQMSLNMGWMAPGVPTAHTQMNYITPVQVGQNTGIADSLDAQLVPSRRINPRTKSAFQQTPMAHEFGHMLGLDEEYVTSNKHPTSVAHAALEKKFLKPGFGKGVKTADDDRIMSMGMDVNKTHYVTLLEALQTATKDTNWTFA